MIFIHFLVTSTDHSYLFFDNFWIWFWSILQFSQLLIMFLGQLFVSSPFVWPLSTIKRPNNPQCWLLISSLKQFLSLHKILLHQVIITRHCSHLLPNCNKASFPWPFFLKHSCIGTIWRIDFVVVFFFNKIKTLHQPILCHLQVSLYQRRNHLFQFVPSISFVAL